MKMKKIAAAVLAALILCSCGNAEMTSSDETQTTQQTETGSETVQLIPTEEIETETKLPETVAETETATETETETAVTLAETSITTVAAEDVTYEIALENAEYVFEKAAAYAAKESLSGVNPVHIYYYFGTEESYGIEFAEENEYGSKIVSELVEDIGGIYIVMNDDDGFPYDAVWAPSMESNVMAFYPEIEDVEQYLGQSTVYENLSIMNDGYMAASETNAANAQAKLVFQNAATYMTKVQIAGVKLELDDVMVINSEYYASYADGCYLSVVLDLSEKSTKFPEVPTTVNGKDVQAALRYYMGGPNGGVAIILVDRQYNPIAALWAKDESSTVVGAFPVKRTVEQNNSEDINITAVDILTAAGGEAPAGLAARIANSIF
jgi:hypothetical protein